MPVDSSEAGVLAPAGALASDATIEDLLQATIRDISGLSGDLVRPRWEPEGAHVPEADVTWVSFGISATQRDTYPTHLHEVSGSTEQDVSRRTVEYEVLVSCYGPSSRSLAFRILEGLQVRQNLQAWAALDLAYVDASDVQAVPSLFKQRWWRRHDTRVRVRHLITTSYPVRTLVSASAGIDNEFYVTPLQAP